MKELVVQSGWDAVLVDRPMPRIAGEYALVQVTVAALCEEHRPGRSIGPAAVARGHEAAGTVVEPAPGSGLRPGQRVVVLPGYACGSCALCRAGVPASCPSPRDPLTDCASESGDCTFAEYLVKPARLLVPVPAEVPDEHAALAGCSMGTAFSALRRAQVGSGDTVLVTGLGPMGLSTLVNALALGLRTVCVARNPARQELARRLGADLVVDPWQLRADPAAAGQVDAAIECAGQPLYQRLALDLVRPGGRVGLIGRSGSLLVQVTRDLVRRNVTVFGCDGPGAADLADVVAVLRTEAARVEQLITHCFPIADFGSASAVARRGDAGKILLRVAGP